MTEDDVLLAVLDAGAEEVNDLDEAFEVVVRGHRPGGRAHRAGGRRASTTTRPTRRSCRRSACRWTRTARKKVFRLIEALEDSDDVQNVWANYDVCDEIMEAVG